MKKIIYSLFAFLIGVSTLNAQTVDRSIRPSSAPAKEINIKDAQVFTLSNGLKVFLVEDKTTPIVYYSLSLDVKPALQGEKTGMYDVFNEVFGRATTSRSKEQLNREIDLIGAQAYPNINGVYISFLKKYEKQALDIFSDILLHPVFTQEEFDLNKDKLKTFLSSLGDDGGQINERVSGALTYGKNYPDGEVTTMKTIENVSIPDLENYYKTYFAPNVSRLVIVGDVSLKEAKVAAEKYLGKWQKKNVPVTKYVIPTAPAATGVAYVVKPGAVQSSLDVSYPVPFRIGQPDYEAARIMDQILGGSGTGHLFLNLRETHSYTYGIYSSLSADELTGRFSLSSGRGAASVKAAVTDSAIYEIFHELNRIIDEPVTEKELQAAKTYRAGSFSRSLENSGTIAQFAVNIDKYKLPKDYYKNYLKRVDAVTAADVQAVAKKYIQPKNAWIVVTGDQAHAGGLLPFASDKTIHYYDYDANPAAAPTVLKAGISSEEIIAKYVKALGGKDAIDKIHDYSLTADVSAMGQTLTLSQLYKQPNKSLINLTMNGMAIQRIAFDGTTLRMSGMGGAQDFTEGDLFDGMKDGGSIVPELTYAQNGYTVEVSGLEAVNGKDAYVLTATKGNNKSVSYFDMETGLKVKSVTSMDTPAGAQQTTTEYSDYRELNGVKFPFLMKQNMGGMMMESAVKSMEINKGIDDSKFE